MPGPHSSTSVIAALILRCDTLLVRFDSPVPVPVRGSLECQSLRGSTQASAPTWRFVKGQRLHRAWDPGRLCLRAPGWDSTDSHAHPGVPGACRRTSSLSPSSSGSATLAFLRAHLCGVAIASVLVLTGVGCGSEEDEPLVEPAPELTGTLSQDSSHNPVVSEVIALRDKVENTASARPSTTSVIYSTEQRMQTAPLRVRA